MSQNKYINPSPLALLSKINKLSNIDIINDYCLINNLSEKKKLKLKEQMLKINYFYPTVVQKKNKEKLQCLVIK